MGSGLSKDRVCCFGHLKRTGSIKEDTDTDIDEEVDVRHKRVLWLFGGGLKVSSGTVEWYRSSCGTDFDTSETASPEIDPNML